MIGNRRRGQATVEYLALLAAVVALLAALVVMSHTGLGRRTASAVGSALHVTERHGDRWAILDGHYGRLARLYRPDVILERDRYGADSSVPVDFTSCRELPCAAFGAGRPVLFLHVVDQPGRTYFEYWFYYPDSRTSHAPGVSAGYHLDDWEGAIVRVDDDGTAVARVSTHGGFSGARPYWSGNPGWRPVSGSPTVYRAAGSHGMGFSPEGIDLAGDAWNGTLGRVGPSSYPLLPGDEAPGARRRFSDDATPPPWTKLVWTRPEAVTTDRKAAPGWRTRAAGVVAGLVEPIPVTVRAIATGIAGSIPPALVEGAGGAADAGIVGVEHAGRRIRDQLSRGIDRLRPLP